MLNLTGSSSVSQFGQENDLHLVKGIDQNEGIRALNETLNENNLNHFNAKVCLPDELNQTSLTASMLSHRIRGG